MPATAAAWLVGLSLVFGSMAFIQEGDSIGRVALVGSLARLLMGALTGLPFCVIVNPRQSKNLRKNKQKMAFLLKTE